MFRWMSRARTGRPSPSARPSGRVRPALEMLEGRDCPSIGMQPNDALWYALNTAPPPVVQVPVMTPHDNFGGGGGASGPVMTLSISYNGQTSVTLSGVVTDNSASVSGLAVTFTGEVSASTVTNSSGYFSMTTNAAGLGNITATTTDAFGLTGSSSVTVSSQAPAISNFQWVQGANYTFTFTATVTDASPSGLTVTFGGIPSLANQTATVQSNGSVELIVQLNSNGSDNGTASAQVTNWWGLTSNLATSAVVVS